MFSFPRWRDRERINKYGIKITINHEAHEVKAKSINVLNLHALYVLHGYSFYTSPGQELSFFKKLKGSC
jgi:hypothetical protein